MANDKQIKMLLAKSRAAGKTAKWDDFKDMENGEIDVLVKELDVLAKKNPEPTKPENVDAVAELNGPRFGMVYKLVVETTGWAWKQDHPDRFIKRVVAEYELATKAERAVIAALSPSKPMTAEEEAVYRREWAERYELIPLEEHEFVSTAPLTEAVSAGLE